VDISIWYQLVLSWTTKGRPPKIGRPKKVF